MKTNGKYTVYANCSILYDGNIKRLAEVAFKEAVARHGEESVVMWSVD
jgi:hypothetical protein